MNNLDARQSEYRGTLDQLAPVTINPALNNLLISINSDTTVPFRLTATNAASLTVNVGPSVIANPISNRNMSANFVGNAIPVLTSGTIVFPAASGDPIVVTPGTGATLTLPTGDFVAVLVYIDNTGQLGVSVGTPTVSAATAVPPPPPSAVTSIGYVIVSNPAGTIIPITQANIFQLSGGSSSSGSSSQLNVRTFTTAPSLGYTIDPNVDDIIVANNGLTGGALVVFFPVPDSTMIGKVIYLVAENGVFEAEFTGNHVTIGNSGLVQLRRQQSTVAFFCDGTNWQPLSQFDRSRGVNTSVTGTLVGTTTSPTSAGSAPIPFAAKWRTYADVAYISIENKQGAPLSLGTGAYVLPLGLGVGATANDIESPDFIEGSFASNDFTKITSPTITGVYTILGFGQIFNQTTAAGAFHVAWYDDGTHVGFCFVIPGATPTLIGSANQGSNFIQGCLASITVRALPFP